MSRLTRGTRLGSAAAVVSGAMTLSFIASGSAHAGQFDYTDTSTTGSWTVPTGTSVVQVVLQGAAGGNGLSTGSGSAGLGGLGANVASSIDVTEGEVLQIGLGARGGDATGVGGANAGGASGFATGGGGLGGFGIGSDDGGGGGGASVVRIGGTDVLVSAGGGGGGEADGLGGLDAAPTGGAGGGGTSGYVVRTGTQFISGNSGSSGSNASAANGGGGGSGSAGGSSGDAGLLGSSSGTLDNGGNGGANNCSGGGGGGGYYGGGGGGGSADFASWGCGGGGAGSSYMAPSRTGTNHITSETATGQDARAQINYIDFTTTTLSSGQVGSNYSQGVVATFGTATSPDSWSISPALPAGLSLNTSTGEITGTPTAAASGTYTVTASYTTGGSLIARSSTSFTLVISAAASPAAASTPAPANAPSLTTTQPSWTLVKDQAVILVPTVNAGGNGTYSIIPDLPEGLSLNQGNGAIGGVPTSVSAQRTYVLTVTNERGSSSASFSLGVDAPVSITKEPETESKAALTRFAPRSQTLTGKMRQALLENSRTACSRGEAVQLVATVPSSVRAAAKTLAHRRGIKVRRFLRSHGCSVNTRIELRAARTPGELRRVELV